MAKAQVDQFSMRDAVGNHFYFSLGYDLGETKPKYDLLIACKGQGAWRRTWHHEPTKREVHDFARVFVHNPASRAQWMAR